MEACQNELFKSTSWLYDIKIYLKKVWILVGLLIVQFSNTLSSYVTGVETMTAFI